MDAQTGARLRAARETRGATIAEVAAAVGVPAGAVTALERGEAIEHFGSGLAAAWCWAVGRHLGVEVEAALSAWAPPGAGAAESSPNGSGEAPAEVEAPAEAEADAASASKPEPPADAPAAPSPVEPDKDEGLDAVAGTAFGVDDGTGLPDYLQQFESALDDPAAPVTGDGSWLDRLEGEQLAAEHLGREPDVNDDLGGSELDLAARKVPDQPDRDDDFADAGATPAVLKSDWEAPESEPDTDSGSRSDDPGYVAKALWGPAAGGDDESRDDLDELLDTALMDAIECAGEGREPTEPAARQDGGDHVEQEVPRLPEAEQPTEPADEAVPADEAEDEADERTREFARAWEEAEDIDEPALAGLDADDDDHDDDTGELPELDADARVMAFTAGTDEAPPLPARSRWRTAALVAGAVVLLVAAGVGVGLLAARVLDPTATDVADPGGEDAAAFQPAPAEEEEEEPDVDELEAFDDEEEDADADADDDEEASDEEDESDGLDPVAPELDADPADAADPSAITVQLLNGSGDDARGQDARQVLEELGYRIIDSGQASRSYERTTVFVSEGAEAEGAAMAEADERLGHRQRNESLNEDVPLHVVVGEDWPEPTAE